MKSLKIQNGKGKAEEAALPTLWNNFFEGPFPSLFGNQAEWMQR